MKEQVGHIHFGADFLGNDTKAWENFFRIYNECEEIFYKMSNEKGQVTRPKIMTYAKANNSTISKMFETGEVSINNQEDFNKVIEALQDTRYRGVNLVNLQEGEKNTIEFRMPNGTINPQVVRENIRLFGTLLQVSKEMSLDPEYKKETFEELKRKDLTEAEKTEALLCVLFNDEQEKSVYRERWNDVKDNKVFEQVKAEKPTFERGNYSMREQVAGFFRETSVKNRAEFVQAVRSEISRSRTTREDVQSL